MHSNEYKHAKWYSGSSESPTWPRDWSSLDHFCIGLSSCRVQKTGRIVHSFFKNRTEQNRTEQNRTEQNRTEQNRTEQNKTKQNKTKQNKTKKQTKKKKGNQNQNSNFHCHIGFGMNNELK